MGVLSQWVMLVQKTYLTERRPSHQHQFSAKTRIVPKLNPVIHAHRRDCTRIKQYIPKGIGITVDGNINLFIGDIKFPALSAPWFAANIGIGVLQSLGGIVFSAFVNQLFGGQNNESGKPAKMLISIAPAGLEQMFFEFGVPIPQGATTALPPTKAEIDKLLAIAPKYGIEVRLTGNRRDAGWKREVR
jgi:hypothetical protein